jgi:hypothetical protein
MSAVPPVEMMSTPCRSSSRAKAAMPVLSETEISARRIFMARWWVEALKRQSKKINQSTIVILSEEKNLWSNSFPGFEMAIRDVSLRST